MAIVIGTLVLGLSLVARSEPTFQVHHDQGYISFIDNQSDFWPGNLAFVPQKWYATKYDVYNGVDEDGYKYKVACEDGVEGLLQKCIVPPIGDVTCLDIQIGEGWDCDASWGKHVWVLTYDNAIANCSGEYVLQMDFPIATCIYSKTNGHWLLPFSAKNTNGDCYIVSKIFGTESECNTYTYPSPTQFEADTSLVVAIGPFSWPINSTTDICAATADAQYNVGFFWAHKYPNNASTTYPIYPSLMCYDIDEPPPTASPTNHPSNAPTHYPTNSPTLSPTNCEFASIGADNSCIDHCKAIKRQLCKEAEAEDSSEENSVKCREILEGCKERCRQYVETGNCLNGDYFDAYA